MGLQLLEQNCYQYLYRAQKRTPEKIEWVELEVMNLLDNNLASLTNE